jgi:hypothetical protein
METGSPPSENERTMREERKKHAPTRDCERAFAPTPEPATRKAQSTAHATHVNPRIAVSRRSSVSRDRLASSASALQHVLAQNALDNPNWRSRTPLLRANNDAKGSFLGYPIIGMALGRIGGVGAKKRSEGPAAVPDSQIPAAKPVSCHWLPGSGTTAAC